MPDSTREPWPDARTDVLPGGGRKRKKIYLPKKRKRGSQALKGLRLLGQKTPAQQKSDSASCPRRFRDLGENPKICNSSSSGKCWRLLEIEKPFGQWRIGIQGVRGDNPHRCSDIIHSLCLYNRYGYWALRYCAKRLRYIIILTCCNRSMLETKIIPIWDMSKLRLRRVRKFSDITELRVVNLVLRPWDFYPKVLV